MRKNSLRMKGKIKRVVDVDGNRVTTQPGEPPDDYMVVVDFFVPGADPADDTEMVSTSFDLKNGNGKFKIHVNGNGPLQGAMKGDWVVIKEVRILDASGLLIGGGVSFRSP
jgi:hypothetical protein